MIQNKYDNNEFLDEYLKLREDKYNSNIIEEHPALFSLIDKDLSNKTVLDLGCCFGYNTDDLIKRNASRVVGVDVSKKMIDMATNENKYNNASYINIDMESLADIDNKFDLIISSLAIHYIKDYNKLVNDVYNKLNDRGVFIFSMEHPITLAPKKGKSWNLDEDGNPISYNLSNYQEPGERNIFWLTNNVIKYHRTFEELINTLINVGFKIEAILEPKPIIPYGDNIRNIESIHKPYFLIIKASK